MYRCVHRIPCFGANPNILKQFFKFLVPAISSWLINHLVLVFMQQVQNQGMNFSQLLIPSRGWLR